MDLSSFRRSLGWLPAFALFVVTLLCVDGIAAQDPADGQEAKTQDPAREQNAAQAMRAIVNEINARIQRRTDLRAESTAAEARGDQEAKTAAEAELNKVGDALAQLRRQFASIASEVDIEDFEATASGQAFNLNDEFTNVIRPIIEELKDATESPRELDRLKSEIEILERRRGTAGRAVQRLEARLANPNYADWSEELNNALEAWRTRLSEIRSRETVARQQLFQRESAQRSLWESLTEFAGDFFRNRGLNLVIGFGTLVAVFFGLRFLRRVVVRIQPSDRRDQLSLYARLLRVLSSALIVVASLVAMLIAFYIAGDWLLLLVTLVFLLGLAWASLNALPQVFEQTRMLLNLGSVREAERIVRDGVPWRIERLQLYTHLVNPKLTGGLLRLPVRDLIGLHSRPIGSDEIWFPTSRGDWVLLPDGRLAEVVIQSPDLVQLRQLGGALITCRTEDFVGMQAINLSNDFRLTVTFGVDYSHQAVSTEEIPSIMRAKLTDEVVALVGADNLVNLRVEFAEAGASSLDYAVLADFRGAVARDYSRIQRAMPRILVDACNEHGWTIPFTQITLHQAG